MADLAAALKTKVGPLPAVAWVVVIGGGIFAANAIGKRGQLDDAAEQDVTGEDSATNDVTFPAGQLRPVVGEHMADDPPWWWPTTDDPLPVIVTPSPMPDNGGGGSQPPQGQDRMFFREFGLKWFSNQRAAFDRYIRSKHPRGLLTIQEWIYGVNVTGGIKRKPKGFHRPNHRTTAKRMGWI